ncbi:DsrE family protein [Sediminicoccus sp. KRV36]|uniref:DsrE family protein n=1 Tax=Sediminicoccus sp. KRV36 TaxID=3133721 RepID=UPI00200D6A2D|nr:DsrE family protein [Sediminicoccus rosea]UPY35573.1 DsrE family protein [Sediminicoccus rosea]
MTKRMGRRGGMAALAAMGAATPALAQAPAGKEKVLYHLNQPGGEEFAYYRQFLVNLRNHLSVLTPGQYDLRVVMHGAGLNLLRIAARQNPQIAASIDEMKLAGVRFEVCRITLRSNNIRLDELYDAGEEDLVPSGVGQLGRLQHQGFAYIKI